MTRRNGSEMQPPWLKRQDAITAPRLPKVVSTGFSADSFLQQSMWEAMLLFPKTTWLCAERASYFDEKKAIENVKSQALIISTWKSDSPSTREIGPRQELLAFASKNWDLLHYYRLSQDPCFLVGQHPQYRYNWIRTIGNLPPCNTPKRRWVTSTLKKSTKASNSYTVQNVKHLEQSDKYQNQKIDRTCKVMIKCGHILLSFKRESLCNSSRIPIHLQYVHLYSSSWVPSLSQT